MASTYGEGVYGNGVGVTTPLSHKMAQVSEFVKTTTPNLIRPGVLYNGVASLVTGRANMAYDVAPFSIVTTRGASAGAVKWSNDGTLTVSTTAAPGSNSRYDVIYAWHREFSIDGVDSNPVIGVVQGTAAASPTVPSLAAFPGAVELARVLVPAGVTATNSGTTFTQTAPFTSVDGGVITERTKVALDLITNLLPGQEARVLSEGNRYRWNGSAWGGAGGGLNLITPGSVAGTGVTLSGAKVTYTNAASISVNNCFSLDYDNYLILVDTTSRSTASDAFMLLRAGGVNNATTNYSTIRGFDSGSARTVTSVASSTNGYVDIGGAACSTEMNVYGPAIAANFTRMRGVCVSDTAVADVGFRHAVAASFDGFSITSAANMTGTLRIYGYNNA